MSRGRMVTIDMHQRSKALAAPPALPLPTGAPLLSEEDTAALISKPDALLSGWTPPAKAPAPVKVEAPPLPKSVREETDRAVEALAKGSRYAYRGEKPVRITADLPKGLYKALKIHSAETGQDIRLLVIHGLAALGIVEK